MRSYKELKDVKVSDMTGAEMAMFNRITDSLKPASEPGIISFMAKGTRGFFRSIGDGFVEKAELTDHNDRKARAAAIREELHDLEEAHNAGEVKDVKYNLIKAQREAELDEL